MITSTTSRSFARTIPILGLLLASFALAEDPAVKTVITARHQITGLFNSQRIDDLRATVAKLPEIKLLEIDFEQAEASFEYDPAVAFPGAKPEQIVERFNERLRSVSQSTFGIKPVCTLEREKLMQLELPLEVLDCQGCRRAAYEAIFQIAGVEWVMVRNESPALLATIDPTQTNREALLAVLKQRGVPVPE